VPAVNRGTAANAARSWDMSAYFIMHRREITDPDRLKGYRKGVDATITRFGGKAVVRADCFEVLEGEWHPERNRDDTLPERVTIIEFPMQLYRDFDRASSRNQQKEAIRRSSLGVLVTRGTAGAIRR